MAKVCPTCGNSYDDKNVFCPSDGSTLRTAGDGSDLIGSVIADRYLITEKLGEGGMGRVYLAQHVRLPQQAAIKVLHPALVHDTDALARFNHEASNACRINDTHVARVYDFGETGNGLVYLAMEYIPGETLSALLKAGAPFEASRVAAITRQIAAGLDAAHKLGIVHRDLKPDNVLVMRDADGEELVKVVDFGIAKAIDTTTQSVTKTGFVLGTAQYMSPEQVSGRVIDRRSDVYALGLVAFMMLTGRLPFEADTAEEVMVKRLTESPRTLAEMRGDVAWPAALQEVFDRALARDLGPRQPTAVAFARELTEVVDAWLRPTSAMPAPEWAASASAPAPMPSAASAAHVRADRPVSAPLASPSPRVVDNAPRPVRRVAMIGGALVAAVAVAAVFAASNRGGGGENAGRIDPATLGTKDSVASDTGSPGTGSTGANSSAPQAKTQPTQDKTITAAGGGRTSGQPESPSGRGDGRVDPVKTVVDSSPPPSPRRAVVDSRDSAAAVMELERVLAGLRPDIVTEPGARAAVPVLRALLPRLVDPHDSLRAQLGRANAHFRLGEEANACEVLRELRTRTSADASAQIRNQMEMFGCQG